MTDHTPEPWKVANVTRDRVKILGPDRAHRQAGRDGMPADLMDNTAIAHIFCPNESEQAANADRIVACVNACAGIPTEQLGDMVAVLGALQDVYRLWEWGALKNEDGQTPDFAFVEAALAPFQKD